ncbi:ABC transporter permease [Bailinhaonella thermotolerans]|uniref:Transport permease protein n=2 Tax=Bailinhaonella thermotolerans TaxID=1070861 RepID=A0A3A4ANE9_9ACTN|nr:ABC transporter permease [Bailinhaonella thermotolerans]
MRGLRAMARQPAFLVVSLVQPLVWLLLFGRLFERVAELPGFGGGSYIAYLVPGVVVMTVVFSAGWAGMAFIDDMGRGILDRLLTTPARRGAFMVGTLAYQACSGVVQALAIFVMGLALGASYAGGAAGVAVTLAAVVLLTAAFSSLSNALALLVRTRESLIGASQFLALPLTFTSSAFMAPDAAPGWIRAASAVNPVDWAVTASREALSAAPDWRAVLLRLAWLAALSLVLGFLATRAFRAYQRSV